jgi:hypothetical protein
MTSLNNLEDEKGTAKEICQDSNKTICITGHLLGMVVQARISNTGEEETGGSRVGGQPGEKLWKSYFKNK